MEVDAETTAALDALCARSDQSREELLAEAVRAYVREKSAFLDFLQQGIDDLESGRWVGHDQLLAELAKRRERRRAA